MIPYSERIVSLPAEGCSVYVLPTSAQEIVTFRGSFLTLPDMRTDEDLVQDMVVAVLDKGTRSLDQFEIAERLDNLGAEISFYSDGLRVGFRGRSLRADVDTVLSLAAEQLREPALASDEIEKVRPRLIASARRSLESTSDQASGALRRNVFPPDHPNFAIPPAESIKLYETIDSERIRAYHAKHFGARGMNAVFVGDIDPEPVEGSVSRLFGSWKAHACGESFSREALPPSGGQSFVSMPDKPNAQVSMGHGLGLRRDDPRFVPLYLANYVLGGNFSARLMTKVRDELGLTYGIRSGVAGVDVEYDGLWEVSVTLSTDSLERGIEATRGELDRFVEGGITQDELDDKKTTVTGSFKVGLATTGGLARTLLANVERGFGPEYLDRFPEEVEECTLSAANDLVRQMLKPEELHLAVAGARTPDAVPEGR